MTLRLRLVLALVALVAVGLAVFGVVTYTLYSASEYRGLDDQIRSSEPQVDRQLDQAAGLSEEGPPAGSTAGHHGPATTPGAEPSSLGAVPAGTYAELRNPSGAVVSVIAPSSAKPRLPASLPAATSGDRLLTVRAIDGAATFRVLVAPAAGWGGGTVVLAWPLAEVANRLHQLILIETAGASGLLLVLCSGAWFVLRRGLRPLERMAGTARSIAVGDLSQRVYPSGGASEVGQLGLALNRMLEDIEAAFRARDATELRLRQFLADASHELRTPLTSIQGFAELFRISGDNARIDLPTILRRIEDESARMKVLVEDLLLLAQLDQPRATERAPVDLAVLAADACSDAVATAPDRAVTLDAPEPVVVAGDEGHLRQAIANLVTNAVRHTSVGTSIDVSARRSGATAVVSVRDHGSGLGDEVVSHVFDRFWQADKARVGTGAGLGLAIVSSIANEHGGAVSAANAEGGGAIFTIRLPATEPNHRGNGAAPQLGLRVGSDHG